MQSQVRFNRVPKKVPEKVREALGQSQVRFNRVPERVPEKVPEKVWESERLWCKARSGSTGFRRRFWRRFQKALVQSQVRFNRVPEKVPEKVPGSFGAKPSQVQRIPEKVAEKVSEKVPEKVAGKVPEKFVFPLIVFVHVHASEKSVKTNVAAVGGTTEAYFWLFFICQESFLKMSVCSSLCSSTPFLAPSLRLCACAALL